MKNLLSLFVLSCLIFIGYAEPAWAQTGRKKVAVVLSGGGAKGAAHVGVLRAIEEAGIPIDYVVGTSMGAVVGGLYAAGYTPSQLDTLIRTQDWAMLLSDKTTRNTQTLTERKMAETFLTSFSLSKEKVTTSSGGIYKGVNLASLFSKLTIGYHDSIDFRKLQTPFACVATDIVNGKEVVFTSGQLAMAIRASMAIPGMFTPVRSNGMVLVDGGLVNNFPVDVARDLGADIIIGSSVRGKMLQADDLGSLLNILTQIISIACAPKYDDNIAACDVHIEVDTGDHTMLDFKSEIIAEMIQQGWDAAQSHHSELEHIRQELEHETGGLGMLDTSRDTMLTSTPVAQVKIHRIVFENENRHEVKTISRQCKLSENQTLSLSQIEKAVRLLQNDFNYPSAYYSLIDVEDGYDLTFHVTNKNQSKLRIGVRFDTDDMVSAVAQGDIYLNTLLPSSVFLYGRVGKQCTAGLGYRFEPILNRSLSLSYQFDYRDIDMHKYGERIYNMLFRKHQVAFRLSNLAVRNCQWLLGAQMEYYDFNNLLAGEAVGEDVNLKSDVYFNYYAQITYQSLDNSYYPTRGLAFDAGYTLITDDFAHIEGGSPVSVADFSISGAISPTSRFAILPSLAGRFLFGGDAPTIYKNMIGANYNDKYLPQQISFAGINTIEQKRDALIVGGLALRQQLYPSHYLTLIGNLALAARHLENLIDEDASFAYGIGLKYGYQSKLGPMEATLGYYNRSDNPAFMINLGYYF